MKIAFRSQHSCVLVVSAGILTACGGGQPVPSASDSALAEQIQRLERSGQLATLDRSTDIRGPDADNNGIRDDMDAWIAGLSITEPQKQAARQMARAQQEKLLSDLDNVNELQAIAHRSMRGVSCLGNVFMPDRDNGYDLIDKIEAITANTRIRAKRYIAYNRALSGSAGRLPPGNPCDP